MRLVYPQFSIDCVLDQGEPFVFMIENPSIYTKIVSDIWNQYTGGSGDFRLLERDKEKSFVKDTCVIMNPLAVDCNERKILNKVYDGLAKSMNQSFLVESTIVNSEIVNYLDKILDSEPFHLDMNMELDFQGLLKLYNVHLDYEGSTLVEKLCDYIRLYHQICRVNLFIFIGLKSYLTSIEINQFYEMAQYEGIHLMLIESVARSLFKVERGIIIDIDKCIIYVP